MKTKYHILLLFILTIGFSITVSAQNREYTRSTGPSLFQYSSSVSPLNEPARYEEIKLNHELINKFLRERKIVSFVLGKTNSGRNVEAWFFPGISSKKALVLGGMHGSELSSIEVTESLIKNLLQNEGTYYNVIVIPSLFPDNAVVAKSKPRHIGSTTNIGRYSLSTMREPNQQMPAPGQPFYEEWGKDYIGREIEAENKLLLSLINCYKPERIASVHAIRDVRRAGVFADPRTDSKGFALGYESDSMLAIEMAKFIENNNGYVPGNKLSSGPNALYYLDPIIVAKGEKQKRNMHGSPGSKTRRGGVSFGTWASTAVADAKDPSLNRDAMRIMTIEFPGAKRPQDYPAKAQQLQFKKLVDLYALAIEKIFLENFYLEEDPPIRILNLETTYAIPKDPEL
ncbi:MAG: hypothetical protein LC128_07420 [Chitinophagales bacterium]|nr:hypothetical protein [Chitinophagales bacterium]